MADTKVISVDAGQDFIIKMHDRSFGGGHRDLLRLNKNHLDLLSTGGFLVRGVPVGDKPPAEALAIQQLTFTAEHGDSFHDPEEHWGREWLVSFDALPERIQYRLNGFVSGNGDYFLRVGGKSRACDGDVVALMSISDGGGYPDVLNTLVTDGFDNPGGYRLIKLSASTPASSSIRAITIYVEAAAD